MRHDKKSYSGLTLFELIIAMAVSSIILLSSGVLLVSANRSWTASFNLMHKQIKVDAQKTMLKFGSIGRKSNRTNYVIYNKIGNDLIPAVRQTSDPEEVISGNAVEFRYWNVELDENDSHGLLDTTKTATAYALFYIEGSQLRLDYGPYPPGAAPSGGGRKNTSNINTIVLADNVSTDPGSGAFSHTAVNGTGQGCVRINLTLTDPDNHDTIEVKTSVMIRNTWPM